MPLSKYKNYSIRKFKTNTKTNYQIFFFIKQEENVWLKCLAILNSLAQVKTTINNFDLVYSTEIRPFSKLPENAKIKLEGE